MNRPLKQSFDSLNEDRTRPGSVFSADLIETSNVLLHPYATDTECREVMNLWLGGKNQPCLFGRIAAKNNGIEFCFIRERDILESEEHVSRKIRDARQLWKRRALRGRPLSGFMLVVTSPRVLAAAADAALFEFSKRIQQLAGWPSQDDVDGNDIVTDWLYIQNPNDKSYRRFEFSVDFFAAAADSDWWHDHRIPGGIAFTANSLGHMIKTNEWYSNQSDQIEWALRTAMLTIASAKQTTEGPATWLLESKAGATFKPFEWREDTPLPDLEKLKDKDHGSYAGYLHTDHAVRVEFFGGSKVPPRKDTPWAMDFSYIFDPASPDYAKFTAGTPVTEEQVFDELGHPADWRVVTGAEEWETRRPDFISKEIQKLLEACRARAAAE